MIHIFILATGVYKELLTKERVETLKHLFPSYNKTLNFISDEDLSIFRETLSEYYTKFEYYHICQLPYPFVMFHKFDYVSDMCKQLNYNDRDYFLYIDAHFWCLPRSSKFFKKIVDEDLSNYDICYTVTPYYNWNSIYDEIDTRSKHHVTLEEFNKNKTLYTQTSFLMGNVKSIHKLTQEIGKLATDDMMYNQNYFRKRYSIIPSFLEQHYANYIFFDILVRNNTSYDFTVNPNFYIMHTGNKPEEVGQLKKTFIVCHVFKDNQFDIITSFRNPGYKYNYLE